MIKLNTSKILIPLESGSSYLRSQPYDRELVDNSEIPVLSIPPEIHEENIEPASIGGLW